MIATKSYLCEDTGKIIFPVREPRDSEELVTSLLRNGIIGLLTCALANNSTIIRSLVRSGNLDKSYLDYCVEMK